MVHFYNNLICQNTLISKVIFILVMNQLITKYNTVLQIKWLTFRNFFTFIKKVKFKINIFVMLVCYAFVIVYTY